MLKTKIVDRKTLVWIKEGVDDTLQFIQLALTEFAENTDDTTPIKTCIGALHRIKGAAQMVEIEGAKALAIELEMLACALVDEKVPHKIEAAEVLAAGMYQLMGYLESLYHGQPDLPLILLPILNDCRACQEKELFSEGDFFSPKLSVVVPVKLSLESAVAGDVSVVAKKLRPGYLSGLLGVIKHQNETKSYEKLIFVLDNLLAASVTNEAQQFWWVACGVVELLHNDDLKPGIAVKVLLGRVDREIHRIITVGEQDFSENPPVKILKNLLYYVAQSQVSSDRVVEIKKLFQLQVSGSVDVDKARESLYGFNVSMIDSVAEQLKEELLIIKDGLDVTKHNKSGSPDGLGTILKNFTTVSDILNMLGMGKQKAMLDEQRIFLTGKISNNEVLDDDDLMSVATALLYVESSLSHLASAIHQTEDLDGVSLAEYEGLLEIVARELLDVLQNIKNSVDDYSIEGPASIALLSEVPDLLKQLSGVMKTINNEQQAGLADAINQYVCQELILNDDEVDMESLDLLADAITGLENYYQAMLEESVAPELGLQVASESISKLGFPPAHPGVAHSAYSDVA